MTQYTAWDGQYFRAYERLGFQGGYVRYRNRRIGAKGGISNTEYVVSDGLSNTVIAIGGKAVALRRENIRPHYHHPYGNDKSADNIYNSEIKKSYDRRLERKMKRL